MRFIFDCVVFAIAIHLIVSGIKDQWHPQIRPPQSDPDVVETKEYLVKDDGLLRQWELEAAQHANSYARPGSEAWHELRNSYMNACLEDSVA